MQFTCLENLQLFNIRASFLLNERTAITSGSLFSILYVRMRFSVKQQIGRLAFPLRQIGSHILS